MAKKAKKRLSGAGQIKASGKQAVLIALEPEDKEAIQKAAALDERSMAWFIQHYATKAAREILARAIMPPKEK